MIYIEIISGIWIASAEMIQNKQFLSDNQIGVILNCTQYHDFPNYPCEKIRLPFSPNSTHESNLELLKKNKEKILSFIDQYYETRNILIACYDGKCLSPMIVALWLLGRSSLNASQITTMLQGCCEEFQLWCDLRSFD